MIWGKKNLKIEKDKIKEEVTKGGEPGGEGKGERMNTRRKIKNIEKRRRK